MNTAAEDFRSRLQDALGSAYVIDRELSGGGMARVFAAHETAFDRRVVVKVLAPELAEGVSAERFAREVRLAARLQHPNIVPLLTAGAAGGSPYYTMPFVEGETLRARLERDAGLSTSDAISILRDIARALASAHEQGIVHRDVKPENVLLSRDAAVVLDFGIAKAVDAARTAPAGVTVSQFGTAVGTPAYMAPEQASGDPNVDHRADLYAFGIVAYELFARRHPFAGKPSAQAFVVAHLIEAPPPLDAVRAGLPPALTALVMRCLAKAPTDRPASAREIIDALGNAASRLETYVRPAPRSIAVLPFANGSADPDNEYFSDGIAEEIMSVLARDSGLRVAARSSSFAFKGKDVSLRVIAEQLHVAAVLEGSVRRAGNRVRITAQLVNASDGYQLWSDRYDRELTDVFAVQDEIATAIAITLAQMLRDTGGDAVQSADAGTAPLRRARQPVSVEAYDEYLKGRHANRDARGIGHDTGPRHFERALALEPKFAQAHAGLAESYLWMAIFSPIPPVEAFARVRRHARRALVIDPYLPDAHWLLAEVAYWHDWDVEISEDHIRRVMELEPYHAGALMTAALCHNARGRHRDALAAAAAAVRADPLGLGTRIWFLAIGFNVLDFDLTVAEATRLIDEHPTYGEAYRWRAMTRIFAGDLRLARVDLETARQFAPPHIWWHVNDAVLASQEGNAAETRRVRDDLVRRASTEWISPVALGQVEQALGDYDAALAAYQRGYQAREPLMTSFYTDPGFRIIPPGKDRSIAEDPRWTEIVRRVGMSL